jgi:hypothetical protein
MGVFVVSTICDHILATWERTCSCSAFCPQRYSYSISSWRNLFWINCPPNEGKWKNLDSIGSMSVPHTGLSLPRTRPSTVWNRNDPWLSVRLLRWDGRKELVCRLNLWRMELFTYMKTCHGVAGSNGVRSTLSPPRCCH